ncbi:hypothetical protein SMICM17S_06625 [Streptomyces microflavus]
MVVQRNLPSSIGRIVGHPPESGCRRADAHGPVDDGAVKVLSEDRHPLVDGRTASENGAEPRLVDEGALRGEALLVPVGRVSDVAGPPQTDQRAHHGEHPQLAFRGRGADRRAYAADSSSSRRAPSRERSERRGKSTGRRGLGSGCACVTSAPSNEMPDESSRRMTGVPRSADGAFPPYIRALVCGVEGAVRVYGARVVRRVFCTGALTGNRRRFRSARGLGPACKGTPAGATLSGGAPAVNSRCSTHLCAAAQGLCSPRPGPEYARGRPASAGVQRGKAAGPAPAPLRPFMACAFPSSWRRPRCAVIRNDQRFR